MTLTTPTSDSTRQHLDQQPRPANSKRRLALLSSLAATLVLIGVMTTSSTDHATMTPSPLLDPQVRGVYRFDSGTELTLLGTERHPRYEMGAAIVDLTPSADDTFTASDDPHEVISVQRARNGDVVGLVHRHGGEPPVRAERLEVYTEHEVSFSSPGAELAGTMFVPTTDGPHPAVVIVHGAEFDTRETYRLLATHYARRGIAALIYDKRGLGSSTGDVAAATFDDLTNDALSGADLLRSHPDVRSDHVGVAGFSQGAWIAALAANRDDGVAFVITYSASGFSPADQNAWLFGNMLAVRGFDGHAIAIADRVTRMLYSTVGLVDAGIMPSIPHVPGFWFHALDLHLDTAALWRDVDQPVLGLWGANDCQVPAADSARAIRDALVSGRNDHHTLVVIEGADHGLTMTGPCEHELGIHHHGRLHHAPAYLDAGADWIHQLDGHEAGRGLDLPADTEAPSLAWHQSPPAPAPWYGTAAVQIPATVLLPLAFSVFALITLVGRRRHLARKHAHDRRITRITTTLIGAGLTATVSGAIALIELASLGDLHSALLTGNGPLTGSTPLLLFAGIAATATALLTLTLAAQLLQSRRSTGTPPPRRHWTAATLGLAATLWAISWHLPLTPWIALIDTR